MSTHNFDLTDKSPAILVVDSGAWYYGSQVSYYRQALDELGYAYDIWAINDPAGDVPSYTDLMQYQILIWTSPADSPGYVDAGPALGAYLDDRRQAGQR